jgi:putative Holliday junction resolvase
MGRILAIDYGLKRTGLAVTDPLQIIATPLETVDSSTLVSWLKEYFQKENVERIVLGMPTKPDQSDTHTTGPVRKLAEQLKSIFPDTPISLEDERFTSKMAMQSMIAGGTTKKYRREKSNVDKISASIILQSYMAGNRK